jgi:CheY-like chemotaxis protein
VVHYLGDLCGRYGRVYDRFMTLESMVVSRDWQEVSVLECILSSLHIGVKVESSAQNARARFFKSKVDALIVDRDMVGSERFLESVRVSQSDNKAVPVVLLSGSPERHDLPVSGATFFFEKPLSVEQAVRTLSAARNLMLHGRLRYHRESLDIPVSLDLGSRSKVNVQLRNLSQGGMGIWAPHPLPSGESVKINFKLPDADCCVQADGELAWTDKKGHAGIRFLDVPPTLRRNLQLWVEKQYFAN